jgi:hypothetical protein
VVQDGWNKHWTIELACVHTEGHEFPQRVLRIIQLTSIESDRCTVEEFPGFSRVEKFVVNV